MLAPTALALVTSEFAEGDERNRALSVFGTVAALGFTAGVILGGALTGFAGWRWVFFVNVPIALAALIATAGLLRPERREGARPRLAASAATKVPRKPARRTPNPAKKVYVANSAQAISTGAVLRAGRLRMNAPSRMARVEIASSRARSWEMPAPAKVDRFFYAASNLTSGGNRAPLMAVFIGSPQVQFIGSILTASGSHSVTFDETNKVIYMQDQTIRRRPVRGPDAQIADAGRSLPARPAPRRLTLRTGAASLY